VGSGAVRPDGRGPGPMLGSGGGRGPKRPVRTGCHAARDRRSRVRRHRLRGDRLAVRAALGGRFHAPAGRHRRIDRDVADSTGSPQADPTVRPVGRDRHRRARCGRDRLPDRRSGCATADPAVQVRRRAGADHVSRPRRSRRFGPATSRAPTIRSPCGPASVGGGRRPCRRCDRPHHPGPRRSPVRRRGPVDDRHTRRAWRAGSRRLRPRRAHAWPCQPIGRGELFALTLRVRLAGSRTSIRVRPGPRIAVPRWRSPNGTCYTAGALTGQP
jgi:hypothetical protein